MIWQLLSVLPVPLRVEDALLGGGRGCGHGRRHHRRVAGQPAHQSPHGPYHYHGRTPGEAAVWQVICQRTEQVRVSRVNRSSVVIG